jgi:hypothetical protein
VDYAKARYGCRVRGAEVQGTQLSFSTYSGTTTAVLAGYRPVATGVTCCMIAPGCGGVGYAATAGPKGQGAGSRCRVRSGYNRRFKDLILREA